MKDNRVKPGMSGEVKRRKSLGRAGEKIAIDHLESEGFRILETNYRRKGGEIDIIARRDNLLVFCEVKTRLGNSGVDPREAYSDTQKKRLSLMCENYLARETGNLPTSFDVRFDLILTGPDGDGKLKVTEHVEDSFRSFEYK